ncbi:metallophosphoesterase [Cohnella lubricantis]|uniref:Metallophosphoesterase n=1 Tax=Cohnella lubricantis TaxID=2163172 RepID=A0A841T5K8_9BACL|nr:metallophosphoesterase [Cohnella lubricantis]MBB6676152.1 metallophosphoesterase [Cohnella lubricantis]MBP2118656.1 putative MPP superfamily phosphohydrolase [Cohnella lubricantis]
MNKRMLLTAIPILLIFIALSLYVGWHGALLLSAVSPGYSRPAYWIVFAIVAFSYLLGRLPLRPRLFFRLLKVIGSYYFAVFEFAILLLIAIDVIAAIVRLSGAYHEAFVPIAGGCVLLVLIALLLWGSRNAWSPVIRSYDIEVDKTAGGLSTLKIAIVSDIHLGNLVGNRHLDRLLSLVNGWQPDVVLLAGDVIDDTIEPFVRNGMAKKLAQLKARYGVYAVLGNHEYYGGHIEEYVKRMKEIGIPVLRDETVWIADAIQLAGRKDKTAESMDPEGRLPIGELTAYLDRSLPIVVMDHQPYGYDQAEVAGVDILVSGHTHRGQFAPNHWITGRLFELDWGYLRKGDMHAFVSSGFGTWGPPIRLASRSELIHLTVRLKGEPH